MFATSCSVKVSLPSCSVLSPAPLPACDRVRNCYVKPVPEHQSSSLIPQLLCPPTASCSPPFRLIESSLLRPASPPSASIFSLPPSSLLVSPSKWITVPAAATSSPAGKTRRHHRSLSMLNRHKGSRRVSMGLFMGSRMLHTHTHTHTIRGTFPSPKCHISSLTANKHCFWREAEEEEEKEGGEGGLSPL